MVSKIKAYLWIVIGSLITAAAMNVFLIPYKIAPGGASGIATVVFHLTRGRLPVGATMLLLNVPLFIAGYRFIGGKFVIRTLFSTIFLSLAIDFTEPYTNYFVNLLRLEKITTNPDLLLYSIFGGFFMGSGLGFVFRSGATTGGTDLAAKIVHKFLPHQTIGTLLLIIDFAVVAFAAIAFRSFVLALYATVALFISSKVIDAILDGVNFAKAVYVISDKSEVISRKIMYDMERGVTALRGIGMHTMQERLILYCVVQRAQIPELKSLINEVDPNAFVILTDVREVMGEGFKNYE
jgi:uncharacterized membrane-anchored protein YitT (DUF2179 family)